MVETELIFKKDSISHDQLVGAVVVLFLPDAKLLERLLNSLVDEVDQIYVIDNTPEKALSWQSQEWFLNKRYNVTYKSLGDNYGIAKAQNIGINMASKSGCGHVILFDQDSALTKGMVNKLLIAEQFLLNKSIKVGSVGPITKDEKTGKYLNVINHGRFLINKINVSPEVKAPVNADYLISSGSLIRMDVLDAVGLMREDLFIDWVDIEWGLRAASLGFLHFAVPSAVMFHSVGDEFVKMGNHTVNLHNDVRNYYIVRNASHLLLDSKIDNRWRANILFKIPLWVLFYSLTSKSKLGSFKLLLRACCDGFSGRLGRYS